MEEVSRYYDRYVVSQSCGNKFMEDVRSPRKPGESKLHLEAVDIWIITGFRAGTPPCDESLIYISEAPHKHRLEWVYHKTNPIPKKKVIKYS